MAWTDERIEQLRQMWQAGMTASQIAEALTGVSRNAVIGKAHRLGLESRPSPVKPGDNSASSSSASSASTGAEPAAAPVPAATHASAATEAPRPTPAPTPVAPAPTQQANDSASAAPAIPADPLAPPPPVVRSIGPGGFQRQNPHEQQSPIPPAPPRRLVPAKPSADIAGKTSLLDLNDRICKWPLGHPGEPDFHFCGNQVNPGFPYCLDHCSVAYQAQLPRRDRRPPPPLPYGGPRVR
jgi:GcrA cell cycle regulator